MDHGKKNAQNRNEPPESTVDDAAVEVSVRYVPPTDALNRLNGSIASLHEARQSIQRIEALTRSLGGIFEQLSSPKATRRHSVLLSEEAQSLATEISKATEQPAPQNRGDIDRLRAKTDTKLRELEAQQLTLAREINRLETAHLNSESSHCALRDVDAALELALSANATVQSNPLLAVGACSALSAKAKTLLAE